MSGSQSSKRPKTALWRPTREFLRYIENHAIILRQRARIGDWDKLDPRALAPEFKIIIVTPDAIVGMDPAAQAHVCSVDAKAWSGGAKKLPGGYTLVILNPQQTPERATATIMEEIAHVHFKHVPSQLIVQADGTIERDYDAATEREAYWTGAAALLPAHVVARAVWRGQSAATLAADFGVSVELAEFRIKIRRLWSDHIAHR